MMNLDRLIDVFVEQVNSLEREADRHIQRQDGIEWVAPVEAALAVELPPSFRSLVTRHASPEFEAGGPWFLANTREQTWHQWRTALWEDQALSGTLLGDGYVQFARPDTGSYDPVCFDTTRRATDGECPLVWIDHEEILCNDRIIVSKEVAPSFVAYVQRCLLDGNP